MGENEKTERIRISEKEDKEILDEWKTRANKVETLDDAFGFIRNLCENYQHDYGTIVHAITAGMIATMRAMDRTPQGGITGFQASFIGWGMIEECFMMSGPKRIVEMRQLLYPQSEHKFTTIPHETFKEIQAEGKKILAEKPPEQMSPRVREHMESVVAGHVPFGLKLSD